MFRLRKIERFCPLIYMQVVSTGECKLKLYSFSSQILFVHEKIIIQIRNMFKFDDFWSKIE